MHLLLVLVLGEETGGGGFGLLTEERREDRNLGTAMQEFAEIAVEFLQALRDIAERVVATRKVLGRCFRTGTDFPCCLPRDEVANDYHAVAIEVGFECDCLRMVHRCPL